jgi:transposase
MEAPNSGFAMVMSVYSGTRACLTEDRLGFGWDGGVHDRHDLSDEQWALLEPLLPVERTGRQGRPWTPHRRVVNAILWRTRTGSPWRDLPAAYGSWQTVYGRHRTWSGEGMWDRVLRGLQRGSDGDDPSGCFGRLHERAGSSLCRGGTEGRTG